MCVFFPSDLVCVYSQTDGLELEEFKMSKTEPLLGAAERDAATAASSAARPIAPPLVTADDGGGANSGGGGGALVPPSPMSSLFSPMNDANSRASNLLSRSSIAQRSAAWAGLEGSESSTKHRSSHHHHHNSSHSSRHPQTIHENDDSSNQQRRSSAAGTDRPLSNVVASDAAAAAPPSATKTAHHAWGQLAGVVRRTSGTTAPVVATTTAVPKSDSERFATVSGATTSDPSESSISASANRFMSDTTGAAARAADRKEYLSQPYTSNGSDMFNSNSSEAAGEGMITKGLPHSSAQVLSDRNIEIAATYILDGIHGRQIGYRLDSESMARYRLYHSTAWRVIFLAAGIVHMCLVLFEEPSSITPMREYPAAPKILAAIEFLCFAVYSFDLGLLYVCFGWKRFKNLWPLLRLLLLSIMLADTIWYIGAGFTSFHLSRAFRPMMLIARLRNVRKMLSGCVVTSFRIYGVFLLLAFHIIFFSLMGYLLFVNTGIEYFSELHLGMYYLFLLSTCFPFNMQLMAPYWSLSRWSGLFFIAFVLIGNLGIFKLIIAVSFKTYKLYIRHKMEDRLQKRRIALTAAFKRLRDPTNGLGVSSAAWVKVMRVLRPKLPEEVVLILFQSVQTSAPDDAAAAAGGGTGIGGGYVNSRAFLQLCSMVDVTFDERSSSTLSVWLTTRYPQLSAARETAHKWLTAKWTIPYINQQLLVVQGIIMIFVLLSAIQLCMVARNTNISEPWSIVGAVLLAIFSAEVVIKLLVLGTHEYWENGFNRLDVVCMGFGVLFYIANGIAGQHALSPSIGITRNFALAIRFLRLLRLLTLFKTCQEILITMSRVLPSVLRLLFVLFFLLYAYAIGGMWLYNGQMTINNPALAVLPWAQFASELNFDDFQSAVLTLFEVANLGNWLIIFDAARALAPVTTVHSTYTYFFTFRVIIAVRRDWNAIPLLFKPEVIST